MYRVVRLKLQDGTAKHRDISTECKRELDADRGVAITAAYHQICWKGRWTQLLSGISGVGTIADWWHTLLMIPFHVKRL